MFYRLSAFILALNVSAFAQGVWSTPVLLGTTSEGRASVAMNSSGTAFATFGNTPNGGAGTIYGSLDLAGTRWSPASTLVSSAYDAAAPSTVLDATGASLTLFAARQYDGLNSAYVVCGADASGVPGSCSVVSSPIGVPRPQLRSYGTNLAQGNNALALLPSGCQLDALVSYSGYGFAFEAPLLNASDCLADFDVAVNSAGNGAAIYRTKAGAIAITARMMTLQGTAVWSTPVVLASASSLNARVAVSSSPDGTVTAAYTVGKAGGKTTQVWVTTQAPGSTFQPPNQVSATGCDLSVSATTAGNNNALVAWSAKDGTHCAPTAAVRPAGASFSAPLKLAAIAASSLITATGTVQGSFVIAWTDRLKSAVYATTGKSAAFSPPVKIGSAGTASLAAGGGYVSAVVCSTTCSATSLALP